MLLADAWVTGWHATELAGVYPTVTVAIFGAGAVGLLAAYSALLRGAAEVYVVDMIAERLEKAGQIGAVPINFLEGDPVEQIVEERKKGAFTSLADFAARVNPRAINKRVIEALVKSGAFDALPPERSSTLASVGLAATACRATASPATSRRRRIPPE